MNEFLSLDWKPRVGVGGEEFQKRGVDEKGGANKIIIQMVRESSFFFPFNSEWSKAILFSLTQMQSIHFVRRPQGEGVSFWNASFTRLLSSGVPFMSGNTMASIFVSREIEISPSFFVCLWSCEFPDCFVISFCWIENWKKKNWKVKYINEGYEDFVKSKN